MADEVESGERKASVASDSPDHANEKESPEEQNQGDIGNAESIPTDWKVWTEEETRTLIQLYKSCSSKYPENYSRKLLFQEIAQDLKEMGCTKDPERIRNRMKSLRTAYRRTMEYNATHILKKNFPYLDDLNEIYKVTPALSDDNDASSHSGYSMSIGKDEDSYSVASSNGSAKKIRIVRTSQTVKPNVEVLGTSKPSTSKLKYTSLRKKIPSKKTIFPLFQCGQCFGKFSTSQELHNHNCQSPAESPKVNGAKQNSVQKKKNGNTSQNGKAAFQWTGMATLQFLTLLKGYQIKSRNSPCNNRNLINNLSTAMKKRRLQVSAEELKKKWKCLAANYEKTLNYNKRHQDQKKCAFYNRLTELYGLGVSLNLFEIEEPVKMTVEVSPFSISASDHQANYNNYNENGYFPNQKMNFVKNESSSVNHNSDLVMWLDSFWKEWKEMERKREEANAERHIELMEILACLAENMSK